MPKITVEVTPVYDWLEQSKAEINILRGGRGSSKSHSTAQFFILNKLIKGKNKTLVIARKTLPSLRKTAMKVTMDLISEWGIPVGFNKSELTVTFGSNVLYFLSVDDPTKIKSLNTNDVWLEEATDFTFEDFNQFNLRCSGQLYLTFNPVSSFHWIKTILVDSGSYNTAENISTYKDNLKFIPERQIKEILALEKIDKNLFTIYGQGEWGTLENIIYSGWKTFTELPGGIQDISYGVDWGYAHPAALIEVNWYDKGVIWRQLIHQNGFTTAEFITEAKEIIKPEHRQREFYAGTDEPGSIQQMYDAGFNVHKAITDVKDGINYCKMNLIGLIGEDIIKEVQGYKRKTDKDGNVLLSEEPIKFMDDGMDAGRYGTYSRAKRHTVVETMEQSFR